MYNISIDVNISNVCVYLTSLSIGIVRFPMLINTLLIVIETFNIYFHRNIAKVKVDKQICYRNMCYM